MLCDGEGNSWEVDNSSVSNAEIIQAFSPSDHLHLHCIINTAGREIFVVAASCREAKIISVYHQHLQWIGGRCSRVEMQKSLESGPQFFDEKLKVALKRGEPGVLWPSGYVSDQLGRLAKERMERLILGVRS